MAKILDTFFRLSLAGAGLILLAGCDRARAESEPEAERGTPVKPAAATVEVARGPKIVRGLYLNAYAAGSRVRLAHWVGVADRTEINAFVIDVKDEKGIRYRSGVELATRLAQPKEVTIRDLKALVDTLHAHQIHAIARIVVFKDPILSKAHPDWSVRAPGGGLWVDKAGNTWVSAWDERVWDYNIDIAEEAARAGFDEIQFDYVRFPEPYRSLPPQVHAQAKGERTEAIVAFLRAAQQRLHPLEVPVTADVFGLSMNEGKDVGIGQQWEMIASTADRVLPMVYPSHYFPTHLKGITRPNRMPYETVYTSVGLGLIRNQRLREAGVEPAPIVPWLQAFNAPWVDRDFPYGPEQVRVQIKAVYDLGLEDWILWHPGSKYERVVPALEPALESRAQSFTPSAHLTGMVDLHDRQGARAARQRVSGKSAKPSVSS